VQNEVHAVDGAVHHRLLAEEPVGDRHGRGEVPGQAFDREDLVSRHHC
jgi:hypothetical protein